MAKTTGKKKDEKPEEPVEDQEELLDDMEGSSVDEEEAPEDPEETKSGREINLQRRKDNVADKRYRDFEEWTPKTKLGKRVKSGEITDIDEILDRGLVILEPEIIDSLLRVEDDLILVGQSKGKFGGGQRRVFKQTQKKTKEGNKPQFTAMAVVGDKNGHVGIGLGKSKETVPARNKALRQAKKNIFKIRRGCGAWEGTDGPNSIPFAVKGRCGSVRIELMPAPKGKGLVCEDEVAKVLEFAGIKDVWSKSFGHTENKIVLIKAVEDALRNLMKTKVSAKGNQRLAIYEGSTGGEDAGAGIE